MKNTDIFKKTPYIFLRKCSFFAIIFSLLSLVSTAQNSTLTGVVSGNSGPLAGVSVTVKGSSKGTSTDNEGKFSISVSQDATLVFSSVGFNNLEEKVKGKSILNITLTVASSSLEQVVIIGYGTQRKKDVTGSSASIKGADILNIPTLTATQAIQGKVAGVQITSSGAPGSAPNVRIRGVGSILGGADPLYVVDGIITGDIRNINSADIVSTDILKDASSTAIYGARAANGVVIITTKAGSKSKFTVNYNGYVGMKTLVKQVKMAQANLYTVYSNEAAGTAAIELEDITGNTNWYDILTHAAFMQNHNVSVSGGKNNYRYFFSGGYLKEEGTLIGNNYQRITLRFNHEMNVTPKLKFGNNLSLSNYVSNNKPYSLFTTAYIASPLYNAKNADGSYGFTTKSDVGNPLAALEYTNDRSNGLRGQGTLWGEYQIIRNLTFRSSFAIDAEQNNGRNYTPQFQVGNTTQKNEVSGLNYSKDSIYQWVWDNILTYDKTVGNHNFRLMAGHTAERRNGWRSSAQKEGLAFDPSIWKLNFADTLGGQQNFRDPIGNYFRRESYFVRANYRFNDKYLINATFRRDANSNFSKANRWGNFPSIGVGWILSKENFLAKQHVFDYLKLRASYGHVGNDVIGPGQFDLRPTERLFSYFGTNRVDGAIVTGIKDPSLKWEVVKEFDFGIELTALKGRLTAEVDYYHKRATDALYSVPLPGIGFGESLITNAADVLNKGLEISLGWSNTINNHTKYALRANATFNKNNVEKIGLGQALDFGSLGNGWTATRTIVGQPIGSFWVFKTNGIFQNADEVAALPHIATAQAGDLRIVDVNGDGNIDNKDRIFAGSYQPKLYGGFNGMINWKKFDFSVDVYANIGNKVYNAKKGVRYGGNYNIEYDVAINRWLPGSNNNTTPRAYNGVPYPTDYFVESGSFIRINNITGGYSIAPKKTSSHIGSIRIYASAQNPFILAKYTGFTPELPGNQNEAGIELNIYPIAATYLVGVNVEFK